MIQELGAQVGFDVDIWDPRTRTPRPSKTRRSPAPPTWPSTRSSSATRRWATTRSTPPTDEGRHGRQRAGRVPGLHPATAAATSRCTRANDSHAQLALVQGLPRRPVRRRTRPTQNGFGTDCGSCYWAEVNTEDNSHPSMAAAGVPESVAVADELYHFDRKPRLSNHVAADAQRGHLRRRDGRRHQRGATSRAAITRSSWCSNFDGGREWSQVLGHNWELYRTPWFRESIYQGILTAGGMKPANCVTHTEVKTLLAAAAGLRRDHRRGRDGRHRAGPEPRSTSTHARQGGRSARR